MLHLLGVSFCISRSQNLTNTPGSAADEKRMMWLVGMDGVGTEVMQGVSLCVRECARGRT